VNPLTRASVEGGCATAVRWMNMGNRQWDFFSRTGMNAVGLLLLTMILSSIYVLWEVAARRWFG